MASRPDEITAFFAANSIALERTVARHVVASAAIIEDACSVAWSKLLRRPDIHLGSDGFWWLYRVAVREVWRLTSEARRVSSLDTDLVAHDDVASTAERRHTLRALDELPERQARILLLQGCGFTYAEIARMTAEAPPPSLILTMFALDDYIYEALSAGASGFVLKDDPPEQLIAAVRTVALGDALLSPAVTKQVIRQFASRPRAAVSRGFDELTSREQEISG
ncbi:MAG TPA: sigma factor-like helix-turn-helix DNA-binding protein [Solirubrobacteraceae bacterium]